MIIKKDNKLRRKLIKLGVINGPTAIELYLKEEINQMWNDLAKKIGKELYVIK